MGNTISTLFKQLGYHPETSAVTMRRSASIAPTSKRW